MSWQHITINRRFAPFFWTQFLGAFNDNFLKNALVVLVAYRGVQLLGLDSGSLVAMAGALFILPFFLFSPLAGQLSDKYEKSWIVRATKLLEIVIMLLAALAFFFQSYSSLLLLLFLMGTQSAFFGPAKYSLIPELVPQKELLKGNALIELGTFLAILLGTISGGLGAAFPQADHFIAVGLVSVALMGFLTSLGVPRVPKGAPDLALRWNPFPEMIRLWKIISAKTSVFWAVVTISWFWFFGAGVLSILPVYVKDYLLATETVVTLFLAMFTLGVGVGSLLCDRLSASRFAPHMVIAGAAGMSLFLFDLYLVGRPAGLSPSVGLRQFVAHPMSWRLIFDFIMMSISGGLFIVPLYTLVQQRSQPRELSRVIAANNILNALFMVVSSLLVMFFYGLGLSTLEALTLFALINGVVPLSLWWFDPLNGVSEN